MATGSNEVEGTGGGRSVVAKGVILTLTGATAVTGGGLLALGSAMNAAAQTNEVDPGSVVLVHQKAEVGNLGLGLANSGLNLAVGNASENHVGVEQSPGSQRDREVSMLSGGGGGAGVLQLTGTASNTSTGTASISTGSATASGNGGSTTISQSAASAATAADPGIAIVQQKAEVTNVGVGIANSGLNLAVGNASSNGAGVSQVTGGAGTTSATATASNTSGGTASITTGAATATGNSSTVNITQG